MTRHQETTLFKCPDDKCGTVFLISIISTNRALWEAECPVCGESADEVKIKNIGGMSNDKRK